MILLNKFLSLTAVKSLLIWFLSFFPGRKGISDSISKLFIVPSQEGMPWSRSVTPLSKSKIALITTGGFYNSDQEPFSQHSPMGDFSYRAIHRNTNLSKLALNEGIIDKRLAVMDANLLFPLKHLIDLEEKGVIGRVADQHYSFFPYTAYTNRVADGSAKDVARRLRYDGVDKAVIIPSSILSQELAGLVQRSIENEGIPTVSLMYDDNDAKQLKVPRACIFSKGSLFRLEEYLDEKLQINLLLFLLDQFESMKEPGQRQKVVTRLTQKSDPKSSYEFTKKSKEKQKDFFEA